MRDIFDTFEQQPDILDQIAEGRPFDPSEAPLEPVGTSVARKEPRPEPESLSLFKKGVWKGLGVIAWPFERIEYAIATPMTTMMEERKKTMTERGVDSGFGVFAPRLLRPAELYREQAAIYKSFVPVVKSLVPWKKAPEEVKTFNDFFGSYYEAMTGEPAPEWYKTVSGTGTSVLVTPWVWGKIMKGISVAAKSTGIPQRIAARNLPAWQKMKQLARLETGARVTDAQDLGRSLGNKEINKLAKALSERTGRNVTSRAVKLRLTQIIKGGITVQPELAAKANPVIEEFARMSKELTRLGILPQHTYVTKLPKREVADLLKKRAALQKQVTKLTEGKKVIPKFPGKNKLVGRYEKQLEIIDEKLKSFKTIAKPTRPPATGVESLSPTRTKEFIELLKEKRELEYLGANKSELKEVTERLKGFIQPGTVHERGWIPKGTPKKISDLIQQKQRAMKRLANITEPKNVKISFPGKAKKIRELINKSDDITAKLQQHYHLGGEQYFPRMYLSKEEAAAAKKYPLYSKEKIRRQFAKERMKIPEEVRKAMGEIQEPAYPVAKRMIQESAAIETGKLFEFAASNPKWVSDVPLAGFVEKALPASKDYGALAGKYVHPTIYKDVTELLRVKGDLERLYDTAMGTWKVGKTIWNPALHFRNMFSNSVLLDLSGVDHIQQVKYLGKAMKHISQNSDDYQQARRYFMRTTMIKGELLDDMLKGFKGAKAEEGLTAFINGINNGVGKVSATPAQVYQTEEFIGKFIKYLEQREKGASVLDAVQEANKWLFDYGDLSTWEKNIARRVMPFYTFPRKALPRIAEAMANRPLVVAKYPMLAKSMTQYSLMKLELSEKDYEQIQKVLPDYMSQDSYILMPYRDDNGDLRFFDWTWNVPWGGLFEAEQRGLLKSTITNPLLTLTFDIMNNKSSFSGRKIYDDAIPPDKQTPEYRREQNFKKMLYVWQALSPNLMYKGIYWDKLYGAATGKKERGKDMLLPEAIAHTIFGTRTQAIDVEEARRWKLLNMAEGFDELRGSMLRILVQRSNGDISDEEFNKKWKVYSEQLMKFHTDAIEEEENAPSIEELLDTMNDMLDNPENYEEEREK